MFAFRQHGICKGAQRPASAQGFNGEVILRHLYAEQRVAAGNVEIDYKRKHYKNTETGALFLFSDVTLALVDYTDWLMCRKEAA